MSNSLVLRVNGAPPPPPTLCLRLDVSACSLKVDREEEKGWSVRSMLRSDVSCVGWWQVHVRGVLQKARHATYNYSLFPYKLWCKMGWWWTAIGQPAIVSVLSKELCTFPSCLVREPALVKRAMGGSWWQVCAHVRAHICLCVSVNVSSPHAVCRHLL